MEGQRLCPYCGNAIANKKSKYCSADCSFEAKCPVPTPEEIKERAAQVRKERGKYAKGACKHGRLSKGEACQPSEITIHKLHIDRSKLK